MKVIDAIKNKWDILKGGTALEPWVAEMEGKQLQLKQKMHASAQLMRSMVDTPGWKMLDEYWEERIKYLHRKLEDGDDPIARAELKHIRKTKSFVLSKLGPEELV